MRKTSKFVVAIAVMISLGPMRAATPSPKDVVDQFVKLDVKGERLSPEGWHRADALFAKPSQPPHTKTVMVIARHYAVSGDAGEADTTFSFGYEEIGRIDAVSLIFVSLNNGIEARSFQTYRVVQSDVNHPSEWKIDGIQPPAMHLTAEAAIRYVTVMRAKTADPMIKKNADRTLAKLAPYR